MSEEEKEAIKFIQGEIKDLLNDIEYYKDYQNIIEKEEVHLKQTLLNLINKQQKVIDLMADVLNDFDYDKQCEECHTDICSASVDGTEYAKCIKEHFYKKVEKENE